MTPDEYEQTIRPALAQFCGYEYSENVSLWHDPQGVSCYPSDLPDPLHNPADAWSLQSALLEKGAKVELYGFIGKVSCDIFPLSGNMVNARQVTPEAALVMAAWEVVRQRRHET